MVRLINTAVVTGSPLMESHVRSGLLNAPDLTRATPANAHLPLMACVAQAVVILAVGAVLGGWLVAAFRARC